MNWSKLGVLALFPGAVCLVSCVPRNGGVAHVTIPNMAQPLPEPTQPSDGIYLEGVKVYDEAALEGLLNTAKTNLAQLNAFDQTSLISHLGAIQGSTAYQSQSALQITGPQQGTPSGAVAPNSPTLPAPSATYTLPSTFQTSASDFLNEQMQLSMQMIDLQLLLAGSFNDQFEHDSNISRIRTTLGFPINISVPMGFKYQGAVAEVEISVCAPDTVTSKDLLSNGGLSLVTLLPREKTYNVASLVSKASSISGGAIAGVVNVGGGFLRSRQTYYLVQDQDTLALQRYPRDSCAAGNAKPVTFAWQFHPVLGEKVVRDGFRQTYAQISFPQDVNTLLRASLPIEVRTGWRHYDPKTGRVGNEIDPFEIHFLKAYRFDIPPSPRYVRASDNGDGTVTVMAMGAFKAGTRVRVGGVVQDSTAPGFEQNQRYLRFIAPALSLAKYGASLLNQDGVEGPVVNPPPILPGPPTITSELRSAEKGKIIPRVNITGSGTHFTQASPTIWSSNPGITVSNIKVKDDTGLSITLAIAPTALPGPSDVSIVTGSEIAVGKGLFTVLDGEPVASVEPFNDSTSLVKLRLPSPPALPYTPDELEVVFIGSHVFGLRDAPFYGHDDDQISLLVTNDLIRTNRQIVWKRLFTFDSQTYRIPFPPPPPTGVSDFAVTGVTLVSYTAGSASPGSASVSTASNVTVSTAASTASDTSGASQKPTNIYAISGSKLSGLRILKPAGVPIDDPRADTLVTFSLTDDQAKAFKSIVVQHDTDQPVPVALPAPPAAASATPAKPSIKAQPATGIPIGTTSLPVTGTGMSQVVSVRYLDTPLAFTSTSDTTLTIQQLPTLAPPGIEVVFVYADKSMASYFIPVQTPGPK